MNISRPSRVCVLLPILASGCAFNPPQTHRQVLPAEFDRRFSPQELGADLDAMIQVFEEVHPDPYRTTAKPVMQQRRAEAEAALAEPMTRVQFYPLAARLAAELQDGHTGVMLPVEEWAAFQNAGGLMFPFDVEWRDEALAVLRAHMDDAPLKPGDRVESINGPPASTIRQWFLEEKSGGETFENALFARQIRSHLWLHRIQSPFAVEYTAIDGARSTATVEGVKAEVILERQKQAATPAPYRFERLPEGVGYLEFRSMVDGPAFDKFLHEIFTDLRKQPFRGLIIDLRKNGGGDSRLGDVLLSYLTDKPYKMADRKEWKVSRRYKEYLKGFVPAAIRWMPLQLFHPVGRKYFGTPEGQSAVFTTDVETPKPNPLRFSGPVCFLIGPFTFSSAMMLANAVEDFDLATLIGEETGGIPNAFGEVYSFDLPHTGLQVGVSSARFVRANGHAEDPRGVRPDIEVKGSEEDVRNGVDTVLERAKTWITVVNSSERNERHVLDGVSGQAGDVDGGRWK